MISIREENNADSNWNKRLENSGLGTIYQTKERAEFLAESGHSSQFLKFFNEKNEIVAQLLIQISSKYPDSNLRNKILNHLPNVKQKKYSWLYGPIIFNSKYSHDIFDSLQKFIKSKNFSVDGWTHPFCNYDLSDFSNNFNLIEWGTFTIDLSKNKDDLYKNITKHSGRKNIERSIKKGVCVEEITEDTLYEYYQLKTSTRIDSGQKTTNYEPMLKRWKKFKPLGFSGFLARYDNKPVGGLLFSSFNDYIIEIGVARSKVDKIQNLYSQELIKWKIIEWGLENKMKYYDLAGFNPHPISKKEEGITRFKKKWGGEANYYYRILDNVSYLQKLNPK